MGDSYEFDEIDVFTSGTLGRPGQRTFFLQGRHRGDMVTLKAEKQQVEALGLYLAKLLEDLPQPDVRPHPGSLEFIVDGLGAWIVGGMGAAYHAETDRIVLLIEEVVEFDDEGEPLAASIEEQGHLRMTITRGQAAAFAERAADLVSAGRPSCQWCARPVDPDLHICVRMN
jgi:uncharacterized repeat protein (TIGR03847 family)